MRFTLTSEAGLNDGLAVPFINAAIAAAGTTGLGAWAGWWFLDDVVVKVAVGVASVWWRAGRWAGSSSTSRASAGSQSPARAS